MKAIILGILSSFFFAFTFVLNRAMEMAGGSWIWSSSLRYLFMFPMLLLIVLGRKNFRALWAEMKSRPLQWLLWSTVGFGLFYVPITFASAYGPGWLIAGTWQVTIVSGMLLSPLFYETNHGLKIRGKIPVKSLLFSVVILAGAAVIQWEHAENLSLWNTVLFTAPVLLASFAYPLGNRKMMEVTGGRLDVFQRVLGMTIASLPFWILLSIYGLFTAGPPEAGQTVQSFIVALTSGVIATLLFFKATDLVKNNMSRLAAVESTQSIQIIFVLIGEILFLGANLPSLLSAGGILLIMTGIVLQSMTLIDKKKIAYINQKSEASSH